MGGHALRLLPKPFVQCRPSPNPFLPAARYAISTWNHRPIYFVQTRSAQDSDDSSAQAGKPRTSRQAVRGGLRYSSSISNSDKPRFFFSGPIAYRSKTRCSYLQDSTHPNGNWPKRVPGGAERKPLRIGKNPGLDPQGSSMLSGPVLCATMTKRRCFARTI